MLVCFPNQIKVDETLVNLVVTRGHPARIVHIVSLPVTELGVGARLVEVIRLTDCKLAHLVNKFGLITV